MGSEKDVEISLFMGGIFGFASINLLIIAAFFFLSASSNEVSFLSIGLNRESCNHS